MRNTFNFCGFFIAYIKINIKAIKKAIPRYRPILTVFTSIRSLYTKNAKGTHTKINMASSNRSVITAAVAPPVLIPFLCNKCIRIGSPPALEGVMPAINRLAVIIFMCSHKLIFILLSNAELNIFSRTAHITQYSILRHTAAMKNLYCIFS